MHSHVNISRRSEYLAYDKPFRQGERFSDFAKKVEDFNQTKAAKYPITRITTTTKTKTTKSIIRPLPQYLLVVKKIYLPII